MTNNLQVWHEKVIKSRFITSCLRTDLQRIDKLYGRLTRCSLELYKLRKEVDVEYISVCGVVTCKDEKTRTGFTEKEKDIELEIATLKKSVDDIVKSRTKLVTSELLQWKNKRGRDYFTKQKERRHIGGGLVIVGELKLPTVLLHPSRYFLHSTGSLFVTLLSIKNSSCLIFYFS